MSSVELSITNKALLAAYDKGYRINIEGGIINPKGKILSGNVTKEGYIRFTVKINGRIHPLRAHRLQAYQKFGDELFKEGIQVRHLNGIPGDNSWDNISIGTARDNHLDKPARVRLKSSLMAAKAKRIFTHDDVREMRRLRSEGDYYSDLANLFGISKGHVCDICSRKLYKDVV